jgi:hypothetical protein
MAVGAGFAGMNTMYAAVARRTKEIGTLRVLGFKRLSILIAFLLESVSIALIGAVIGILLALPLNFVSTGTSNFVTFSEIALQLSSDTRLDACCVDLCRGHRFCRSLFAFYSCFSVLRLWMPYVRDAKLNNGYQSKV